MTKLHEVLAVEADKEGIAKAIIAESEKNFSSKHELFQGMDKVLEMSEEGNELIEEAGREYREINTTVPKRLAYTADAVIDWLDVVLQKEASNQAANADITIDGSVLAANVPVTFLLSLETKLKHLRKMYLVAPTLPPGMEWALSEQDGEDVYKLVKPEVRVKTAKTLVHKELAPATDKHPAQIEHWNEDVAVGKFTTQYKAGLISSARKHELLGRIDSLIQAVKQARMRANSMDVLNRTIGQEIFDYLHA